MRLALFFTLSLALHVSVLVYPIRFNAWQRDLLIAVTIMPIESAASGVGGNSGQGINPKGVVRGRRPLTKKTDDVAPVAQAVSEPIPTPSPIEVSATTEQTNLAFSGSPTADAEDTSADGATGRAGRGVGGKGFGSLGAGLGSGTGSSPSGSPFIQARYRNTPPPVYPENARREGREGRVLLRVLIDDQGKTKNIEVNRSSGSAALDRAAAEAIRQWRFHPALSGEKPVESWVTIPIDFRLMDERS
jgi:periplasmic protein TonB